MVIPDVPATALAASPDEDAMLVGGDFSRTDRAVGSAVVVDRAEANEVTHQVGWPYVEGEVEAAVPDGQGGWYVGGDLTRVGGEARGRLAHLRGDRSLDPDWFAGRHVDFVHSLLLDAARRRLIVAGTFSSIGGHRTGSAARLGRVDGAPVWREPRGRVAGGTVEAIASDGLGGHFIGGGFTTVDGVRCGGFARLRADGTLDRRWCRVSDFSVKAIAIAEGRVYLGGSFRRDGRSKAAAYDIATGDLTDWNPNPDFDVRALIAANGRIYAGGDFRNIGGQPRSRLAALDPDTGAALEAVVVHVALDARGRAWGLARFDLAASARDVVLRMPPGMRVFDILVDGREARATPLAGDAATPAPRRAGRAARPRRPPARPDPGRS
jgi:hypothetical protein